MALSIETFSNLKGGECFFKAVGHPLAAAPARALVARLKQSGPIAIYDPLGVAEAVAALHDLSALEIAGVYVQAIADIGKTVLGQTTQPVTDLPAANARMVLIAQFDAERALVQMRHLLPAGAEAVSLDAIRLPAELLANRANYLDPLNFATNFAFFRDAQGCHTRVATANYWHGYGARGVGLWLALLDAEGRLLAQWQEALPDAVSGIAIDSREVRQRFGLADFCGQLFLHVIGARGHDVVKYALDIEGESPADLTCTHDANAWPADYYAGLPAPRSDERVVLWVQNSHPAPIPKGAVGLGLMGSDQIAWLEREVPPFGSYPLDVAELLPDAHWPQQIEVHAGRHFVRPRYEITTRSGKRRMAHANVERTDLRPDPELAELANLWGKGFVLPAPVLPQTRFRSLILPTPMARSQAELPLGLRLYDASGRELASCFLGRLPRPEMALYDVAELGPGAFPSGYGHLELVYDFRDGGGADGWLHALFRYEDRQSGHAAETSFGAHVFNSILTAKGEPQSYHNRPPGLSTRLFLRLGRPPLDSFCHLIYAASTPWHPWSTTTLTLVGGDGSEIAKRDVRIACSGSLLWRASEMFGWPALEQAGPGAYVIIRDPTCRLFGYHGLEDGTRAFSLDHMFGF